MIKDKLEIFIITYNRCKSLENTLDALLSKNSPVRDVNITIIDNNSTDNTNIMVLSKKTHNVHYIKNKRNVGLAGNYCKALELVSKQYYWILADDDSYCWDAWKDVEEAITNNADFIILSNIVPKLLGNSKASAILASGWLHSVIINSKYLEDDVVAYAYNEIPTIYPQISVSCNYINKGGGNKIITTTQDIVLYGNKKEDTSIKNFNEYNFNRIPSKKIIHPRIQYNEYYANLILACRNIHDDIIYNKMIWWLLQASTHIKIKNIYYNIFVENSSKIMFMNMFFVLPFYFKIKMIFGLFLSPFFIIRKVIKKNCHTLLPTIKQFLTGVKK